MFDECLSVEHEVSIGYKFNGHFASVREDRSAPRDAPEQRGLPLLSAHLMADSSGHAGRRLDVEVPLLPVGVDDPLLAGQPRQDDGLDRGVVADQDRRRGWLTDRRSDQGGHSGLGHLHTSSDGRLHALNTLPGRELLAGQVLRLVEPARPTAGVRPGVLEATANPVARSGCPVEHVELPT